MMVSEVFLLPATLKFNSPGRQRNQDHSQALLPEGQFVPFHRESLLRQRIHLLYRTIAPMDQKLRT